MNNLVALEIGLVMLHPRLINMTDCSFSRRKIVSSRRVPDRTHYFTSKLGISRTDFLSITLTILSRSIVNLMAQGTEDSLCSEKTLAAEWQYEDNGQMAIC